MTPPQPLPAPDRRRFALGRIVATPGALKAITDAGQTAAAFIERHARGDWGDLCEEDRTLNDEAIAHEGDPDQRQRVLSAYATRDGIRLYCITECDRSVTTLLRRDEY